MFEPPRRKNSGSGFMLGVLFSAGIFGGIAYYANSTGMLTHPTETRISEPTQSAIAQQNQNAADRSIEPKELPDESEVLLTMMKQPTLIIPERRKLLFQTLSAEDKESIKKYAEYIDATLEDRPYNEILDPSVVRTAMTYIVFFNQVKFEAAMIKGGRKCEGYDQFRKLRYKGDDEDFKRALIQWARMGSWDRAQSVFYLEAIRDKRESVIQSAGSFIRQYPDVFGLEY